MKYMKSMKFFLFFFLFFFFCHSRESGNPLFFRFLFLVIPAKLVLDLIGERESTLFLFSFSCHSSGKFETRRASLDSRLRGNDKKEKQN